MWQNNNIHRSPQAIHQFSRQTPTAHGGGFRCQSEIDIRMIIKESRLGEGSEESYLAAGQYFGKRRTQLLPGLGVDLKPPLPAGCIALLKQCHGWIIVCQHLKQFTSDLRYSALSVSAFQNSCHAAVPGEGGSRFSHRGAGYGQEAIPLFTNNR